MWGQPRSAVHGAKLDGARGRYGAPETAQLGAVLKSDEKGRLEMNLPEVLKEATD
jgi:hypothetical protein